MKLKQIRMIPSVCYSLRESLSGQPSVAGLSSTSCRDKESKVQSDSPAFLGPHNSLVAKPGPEQVH